MPSKVTEGMATSEMIKSEAALRPRAGSGKQPGVTFAHQAQLSRLPIPDLEDTCRKYLAAVKPLETPREFRGTEASVREFLRKDGPELQERLKKYAANKPSYIEQFCKHFKQLLLDHFLMINRVRFIPQL